MANAALVTKLYRIMSWVSLAGLALVLILVLRKSPPPHVEYDPNAAARVQQKFANADQAKAAGQPAQVEMDPTELNSYLKDNLQTSGSAPDGSSGAVPNAAAGATGASSPADASSTAAASTLSSDPAAQIAGSDQAAQETIEQVQSSVKDVKVDMDGDLVKAYLVFNFHGKDLSLELDGHLSTQDGYLKFDPVAGKLGSLPLPQSTLESAVEKMLASPENRDKLKLPPDVSDIEIQNGQAVVSYK
ncbi:MAG: hypothetical protein ACRD4C_02445 [Candidatus Acidiferrales bacterium]